MHAGDMLFYPSSGSLTDTLITRLTNGPFPHCEVAVSDTESIGALSYGVVRHVAPPGELVSIGASLPPERLAETLTWLSAQVGDHYSYAAIAADALKLLLPRALGSRTPFLIAPHAFDCSWLCATALVSASYPLPADMIADLPRVSPNDLARALGVFK